MDKGNSDQSTSSSPALQEGIDFYVEDGLFVFTEKYLRERGYCCKSGCRHCPYGFKVKDGNSNPKAP